MVHVSLSHNGISQYDLPPTRDWRERIGDFFGPEIASGLLPIVNREGDISLTGFVVDPAVNRANNRMQYLFLNGRYIRDRSLQHALGEAYRGLLMTGRYPIAFLQLEMPPGLVDVNVHPAKLEVRFQDGGKIYSQLLGSVRSKFLSTDLTARAKLNRPQSVASPDENQEPQVPSLPLPAALPENQSRMPFRSTADPIDWTRRPREPAAQRVLLNTTPMGGFPTQSPLIRIDPPAASREPFDSRPNPNPDSFSHYSPPDTQPVRPTALQVHNTYLISETDEGMVVVDQHALHERIIYEQLREKVLAGKLETQRLLVPEPVTLPPAEAAAVLENGELLKQIGMTVEPFGGDTVLVSAYPAMLANQNPAEMLRNVVELVMAEGRQLDQRDLVDQLLHMISCKAAVKAGDKLTPEEINDLLEHRQYCQDSHHCPHGRPTALVFSREELDRRFKRV